MNKRIEIQSDLEIACDQKKFITTDAPHQIIIVREIHQASRDHVEQSVNCPVTKGFIYFPKAIHAKIK